jgi:acyl transferase domain-containing protein/thioesterase domain-containing protein
MDGDAIAILSAAGRFPGARDLDQYWNNLVAGVESIHRFTDDELRSSGVSDTVWQTPGFVRAAGVAPEVDLFDADFFGISPAEARLICPQQRILLEHGWEALERAGYDPHRVEGRVGVFVGSNASTYLIFNILSHPGLIDLFGHPATLLATDKDYLATRLSYALDLRGPSVAVNTACSTSLVAVHLACQSVLAGECDMAIAGAATVHTYPGYLHQDGLPLSPDGQCRPFDASAAGAGIGSGAGVVLLKLLSHAQRDGDQILAILLGSAVNNDGARKVSYTAPSTTGEEQVIAEALAVAGIEPSGISYVETHGTATPIGDPIEVEALTRVFAAAGAAVGGCGIGSVKSNFGHLGAAAGMAGLIKVILSLGHRRLPPTLHYAKPNANLNLDRSPFRVIAATEEWSGPTPLRAGVSSFGVGGTNSHVLLEEPPRQPHPTAAVARNFSALLLLSARTTQALERTTDRMADHLRNHPEQSLDDVAYTLHAGRHPFERRRALIARDIADAAAALAARDPSRLLEGMAEGGRRPIAFLFPGGGPHHVGMGQTLYATEPIFRAAFDRCRDQVRGLLGIDLFDIVGPDTRRDQAERLLERAAIAATAVFSVSWSLCALWKRFGIEPDAVVGYSTGEYTAAAVAGVMNVEDALTLLVERLDLIDTVATRPGGMLSVPLPQAACQRFLDAGLSLAADNGRSCVLAGPRDRLEDAANDLARAGTPGQMLRVPNAYHSAELEPVLEPLQRLLDGRTFSPPKLSWISTVTGAPIHPDEAIDPAYWVRNCRGTVRYSAAVARLLADPRHILLEVGPGTQMGSLARQQETLRPTHLVLSSMPHPREGPVDRETFLSAAGRLWLAGLPLAPDAFGRGRRIALPTYPFERRRHWIDPRPAGTTPIVDRVLPIEMAATTAVEEVARAVATPYVAPRTAVEKDLVAVWERALGTAPIGIHDDFFELGGNSLLGIQLYSQLAPELKKSLNFADLLGYRTIAALSGQVEGGTPSLPPGLMLLREGAGDPVFCPHALLGGAAMVYQSLIANLACTRPFYGLVAAGLDGREQPRETVEEMADAYTKSIKSLQARGPYRLIGFSTGGLIAFEIARRLRMSGDEVAMLALLDARAGTEFPESVRREADASLLDEFVQSHLQQLVPRDLPPAEVEPIFRVARATAEATLRYEPTPYDGSVVFFSPDSADNPFVYPSTPPEAFWSRMAAAFELKRVPGNHYSMMSPPHAPALAGALAPLLDR